MVQWLRLHAPNAGSLGSVSGQGSRARRSQLRDLACCNEDQRSPMLQLGLGAAKQIDRKKQSPDALARYSVSL